MSCLLFHLLYRGATCYAFMGFFARRVALLSQALRIKCLICVTGGSQYARLPLFLPFAAGKETGTAASITRLGGYRLRLLPAAVEREGNGRHRSRSMRHPAATIQPLHGLHQRAHAGVARCPLQAEKKRRDGKNCWHLIHNKSIE